MGITDKIYTVAKLMGIPRTSCFPHKTLPQTGLGSNRQTHKLTINKTYDIVQYSTLGLVKSVRSIPLVAIRRTTIVVQYNPRKVTNSKLVFL